MDKTDATVVISLIAALLFLCCYAIYENNVTTRIAFEQGYEKVAIVGETSPVWQKAK